jgi:hypothetical protein
LFESHGAPAIPVVVHGVLITGQEIVPHAPVMHETSHLQELSHRTSPHAKFPAHVTSHAPVPSHRTSPHEPFDRHDTVHAPSPHVITSHAFVVLHVMLHCVASVQLMFPHALLPLQVIAQV